MRKVLPNNTGLKSPAQIFKKDPKKQNMNALKYLTRDEMKNVKGGNIDEMACNMCCWDHNPTSCSSCNTFTWCSRGSSLKPCDTSCHGN